MNRFGHCIVAVSLGLSLAAHGASAADAQAFMGITEWQANITLVRDYGEEMESGATRSETHHQWRANGRLTLSRQADAAPEQGGWTGRSPVSAQVRNEVLTTVTNPAGGGLRTRLLEEGQAQTDADLMLFIDPRDRTYTLSISVAAFDVQVLREDWMLMPGDDEGRLMRSETRTRNGHNYGASARDQPLPANGLELTGRMEAGRDAVLEWSISPVSP